MKEKKTIEQVRAADALSRIDALQGKSDDFKKRYRAYADRLGPAIVMNGLGQALATELAADEPAHRELYVSLQNWLCRKDGGVYPSSSDILRAIVENDEPLYVQAQAEALAWLEWHKKCCRAAFPKGDGDER